MSKYQKLRRCVILILPYYKIRLQMLIIFRMKQFWSKMLVALLRKWCRMNTYFSSFGDWK